MKNTGKQNLLDSLGQMSAPALRRPLTEHLTRQKLSLYWERDAIEHDKALNANVVLPRLVPEWSHTPEGCTEHRNLIIEGGNFDSLRLLRAPHAGKVRVIYVAPPYNTGNKDWVFALDDGSTFSVGGYDVWVKLNALEQAFARALDEADFVHWWHRNPDKKPYSVRVERAEHDHYFYPDFVVCVSHEAGEAPMQRLLETKESTKDAARKSQHFPAAYGKVQRPLRRTAAMVARRQLACR